MIESIINTVFSLPYLAIGVVVAAIIDLSIYYTQSSKRFTLLEIWGCTMCWPIVLVIFGIAFFKGGENN